MALAVLGGAALGAGGSILGQKARDKERIKRIEPPERKFANALLMMEAARGMTGKLSFADELEQNRLRSQNAVGQQNAIQSILRAYGQGGVEGPGKFEAIKDIGTSGMQAIINALNKSRMQRRGRSVNIANMLLRENQPYREQTVEEGPTWAKALSSGLMGAGMGMGASKPPMGAGMGVSNKPLESITGQGGFKNLSGTGTVLPPGITRGRKPYSLTGNRLGMMGLNRFQ